MRTADSLNSGEYRTPGPGEDLPLDELRFVKSVTPEVEAILHDRELSLIGAAYQSLERMYQSLEELRKGLNRRTERAPWRQ
jgi:hypothetical protein